MELSEEIDALATRTLATLEACHDYYTYTKRVWRLMQKDVGEGRTFTFRNLMTGTRVNERELAARAGLYVTSYLRSATFQQFVSCFEDFVFGLLRHWLTAFPHSLTKRQIDFGSILRARDKTAIILVIVEKELNELKYERVSDWFAYMNRLVKLDCPTNEEIEQIAEIKASRDILVHNAGLVNSLYVSKAGPRARYREGENLDLPEIYHRESWEMIRRIIREVAVAAVAKARPKLPE